MSRRLYKRGEELKVGSLVRSRVRPLVCTLRILGMTKWEGRKRLVRVQSLTTGQEFEWKQAKPRSEGGETSMGADDFDLREDYFGHTKDPEQVEASGKKKKRQDFRDDFVGWWIET